MDTTQDPNAGSVANNGTEIANGAVATAVVATTAATTSNTSNASNSYAVTLIAKWGKEKIELTDLPPTTNIAQVKDMLSEKTNVLPKRQKLIGLATLTKGTKVTDELFLSELKPKSKAMTKTKTADDGMIVLQSIKHNFILMGTAEKDIFVDPMDQDQDLLPEVVDDFDLDFNAGSQEWLAHVATGQNLKKFTESTDVNIIHAPRTGKPLMVLDLDHTLLDFSRKSIEQASTADRESSSNSGDNNNNGTNHHHHYSTQETIERMKRPYMDEFLAKAYQSYDLVVWSQTSWRWLETKLIELGMLANPRYRFCFVLDKTSMFAVTSTARSGKKVKHYVKPLQIIWNKFPGTWGPHNTVHLDDLSRNFALNPGNGLKVSAFYRKKQGKRDVELLGLAKYLEQLASDVKDFTTVEIKYWQDVVAGKKTLLSSTTTSINEQGDDHDETMGPNNQS
jgi:ubiquitin-like domain-containing CTD phosphatase 1